MYLMLAGRLNIGKIEPSSFRGIASGWWHIWPREAGPDASQDFSPADDLSIADQLAAQSTLSRSVAGLDFGAGLYLVRLGAGRLVSLSGFATTAPPLYLSWPAQGLIRYFDF